MSQEKAAEWGGGGQSGLKVDEKAVAAVELCGPAEGGLFACVCVCLVLGCHYMAITYNKTTNGPRLGGVDSWVGWGG